MSEEFFRPDVAVVHEPTATRYPSQPPFNPSEAYAEYPWAGSLSESEPNHVYGMVREGLHLLRMDEAHFGHANWNPLGGLVSPGDHVVIKPNAVMHYNVNARETVFASITHPSVLRPVIDYTLIALRGEGEVAVADCPIMSADFGAWRRLMALDAILAFYLARTKVPVRVLDLRETVTRWVAGFTPVIFRRRVESDPLGYTVVDLGSQSLLQPLGPSDIEKAYGADYRVQETIAYHTGGRHAYRAANTVLDSDVLISVPKLKVHSKVGVTVNVKGMVGIIGDKNSIVHARRGPPSRGGDEYPADLGPVQERLNDFRMYLLTRVLAKHRVSFDLLFLLLEGPRRLVQRLLVRHSSGNRKLLGGSWHGNDTAWRMGCDLLRIALYGRRGNSSLARSPRRFFSVVDGIIGGEGDGPLAPTAKPAGVVLCGFNPVAVDWVAARLINFDPERVRMLLSARAQEDLSWRGADLPVIRSARPDVRDLWQGHFHLNFLPPRGWTGHVEKFPVPNASARSA